MSIQCQQGFLSALQRTSKSTPGGSLSVHQDTVEDPVVLAQILFPQVDKIPCKTTKRISKITFLFVTLILFYHLINPSVNPSIPPIIQYTRRSKSVENWSCLL